jgi:NAD(P)-dependent dehydrogenase (short-subunit alcohol dehydrogenase family)
MNNLGKSPQPSQTALVTGAADRVGAVLAKRLAAEGFAVLVHYNSSRDKAEAVVAAIRDAGGQAASVQANLTDPGQRSGLVAAAAHPFGPLTLLVNNASLFKPDSIADIDEALWDAHFAIHAEAPIFLARDFAAQLPAGAQGNIVNIIDARVLDLSPAYLSYTLSKATLWTATRTLAQSLAPRIRVNAIGPGPTLPPPGVDHQRFEKQVGKLPLQQSAGPDGIADGLMAILSLDSMTGQMLALDGGEHLEWPERRGTTPRR